MVSYKTSQIKIVDVLRNKNITLFNSPDLLKLFPIRSDNTLKQILRRLKQEKLVESLIRDKYIFLHAKREVEDFEIANFLATPSYISLESALSYYGMIDQFPYKISSITVRRAREYKVRNKIFQYSKIAKQYFQDFVKVDNFLIASKEKALFDYLYFSYKGLRSIDSLGEFGDYLKQNIIKNYIKNKADNNFLNFLKKYVKF